MFTRKHYERMAEAFVEARGRAEEIEPENYPARIIALDLLDGWMRDLADILEKDNPRFDRGRFYKACGAMGIVKEG
jgi:hypothetical protein